MHWLPLLYPAGIFAGVLLTARAVLRSYRR